MKTIVKIVTLILGILALFLLGATLINAVYNETYQLLLYDVRIKFQDNRGYVAAFIILLFLTVWGGKVYWQTNPKLIMNVACITIIVLCVYIQSHTFFADLPKGTC